MRLRDAEQHGHGAGVREGHPAQVDHDLLDLRGVVAVDHLEQRFGLHRVELGRARTEHQHVAVPAAVERIIEEPGHRVSVETNQSNVELRDWYQATIATVRWMHQNAAQEPMA